MSLRYQVGFKLDDDGGMDRPPSGSKPLRGLKRAARRLARRLEARRLAQRHAREFQLATRGFTNHIEWA